MTKRSTAIWWCVGALALGGILYILFRADTHIARLFDGITAIQSVRGLLQFLACDFVCFYLPDFLWSFSLCCGLIAVFPGDLRRAVCCGLVTATYGIAWEAFQTTALVSGTGDIVDAFMYLTAATTAVIFNVKGVSRMKKLSVLLAVLLVVLFSVFALASGSSDGSDGDQGSGNAAENGQGNDTLGEYSVVIDSCRLAEDYEGDDVVIVKYVFTNNANDDATSFMVAFEDTVYQNGVGLNEAYILANNANYSADNQTKEIKKGASIEVEVAYELNDTTTDIEVEVKELFSFSDKTLKKTFTIA